MILAQAQVEECVKVCFWIRQLVLFIEGVKPLTHRLFPAHSVKLNMVKLFGIQTKWSHCSIGSRLEVSRASSLPRRRACRLESRSRAKHVESSNHTAAESANPPNSTRNLKCAKPPQKRAPQALGEYQVPILPGTASPFLHLSDRLLCFLSFLSHPSTHCRPIKRAPSHLVPYALYAPTIAHLLLRRLVVPTTNTL